MAKSFYNILAEKEIEVNHQGEDVVLDLPEWLTGASEVLEDEKALTDWAKKNGCLHGLLHYGIQQFIIKIRAIARPDEKTSIITDRVKAQERVNKVKCEPVKRPGTSVAKKAIYEEHIALAQAMRDTDLPTSTIKDVLSKRGVDNITIAKIMNETAED